MKRRSKKWLGILVLCALFPIAVAEMLRFDVAYELWQSVENAYLYFICYVLTYVIMNILAAGAVYVVVSGMKIQWGKHVTAERLFHAYLIIESIIIIAILGLGYIEIFTLVDVPIDEPVYSYHINPFLLVYTYIASVAVCSIYAHIYKSRNR